MQSNVEVTNLPTIVNQEPTGPTPSQTAGPSQPPSDQGAPKRGVGLGRGKGGSKKARKRAPASTITIPEGQTNTQTPGREPEEPTQCQASTSFESFWDTFGKE